MLNYFEGFYKKPKGLKKPYNPILGETFRCCWSHPNGSKTFYIAEQVQNILFIWRCQPFNKKYVLLFIFYVITIMFNQNLILFNKKNKFLIGKFV